MSRVGTFVCLEVTETEICLRDNIVPMRYKQTLDPYSYAFI